MKVHHLDCCTMCPVAGRWLNEDRHMVAHCLLIETDHDGLVLIDTGIGLGDVADPAGRLGRGFVAAVRPVADESRTAIRQVEALGFRAEDVRHIVPTHLDLDHVGGLGDFPDATVHVHAAELDAAMHPRPRERQRYRPAHWAHGPRWETFGSTGEAWFGFEAVRDLPGLDDSILVVPLPGHTRGHVVVAIEDRAGHWMLHCGDAYFHEHTVDPSRPPMGPALRAFEQLVAVDRQKVRQNHDRLRALAAYQGDEVDLFCAHDPAELARARASSPV